MIRWFSAILPIRVKFAVLTFGKALLAAMPLPVVLRWGREAEGTAFTTYAVAAAVDVIDAINLAARKLICDPYVSTFVRMDALAAGEFAEPIRFAQYQDYVGRMARAMATFCDNDIRLATASAAQQYVVTALGK